MTKTNKTKKILDLFLKRHWVEDKYENAVIRNSVIDFALENETNYMRVLRGDALCLDERRNENNELQQVIVTFVNE